MRRILRVFATATFLNLAFVLAVLALSGPAQAQETVKDDLMASAPLPQTKPAQCRLPIAALADLVGWRILNGSKAAAYISTAFKTHPPADTVAFTVVRDKALIVLARDGCVTGRQMIEAKMHRKVIEKAFGILA